METFTKKIIREIKTKLFLTCNRIFRQIRNFLGGFLNLTLEACVIQLGTQSPLAVAGKVLETPPKTVPVNCLLAIGTAAPTSVAHAVQVLHIDGRVEAGM